MREQIGIRNTKKLEALLRDGREKTGLTDSALLRLAATVGLPIVVSRLIGTKKTPSIKF